MSQAINYVDQVLHRLHVWFQTARLRWYKQGTTLIAVGLLVGKTLPIAEFAIALDSV